MSETEQQPRVALRQMSAARAGLTEDWSILWEVANTGDQPIRILTARLPHGQFKSKEMMFEPPLDLRPRQSEQFQTSVRCNEPSGPVTENAFVIFLLTWMEQSWRIFARIRVVIDDAGMPQTTTESITTQRAGFSGITD